MDIVFAVLPFSDVRTPSIGVSTLLAAAKRAGFSGRVEYVNLQLAAWIGRGLYEWIGELGDPLLLDTTTPSVSLIGDWFFTRVLFPGQLPSDQEYLAKFVAPDREGRERMPALVEAREKYAAQFVEYAARSILRHNPRIVGFSTTFHLTGCLSVAKVLKQAENPPTVILGGANCEGEMGLQLIRSFPWIDYICTGEGDAVLPEFLERYLGQNDPEPPQGILRQGYADELRVPKPISHLDSLPVPDYREYFEQLGESGLEDVKPFLQIQTARGCWWGEKYHCTFCGLNGQAMAYRSKSPERVMAELRELSEAYGLRHVESVDNILDTRYIQTVFPELIRCGSDLELFFEIKSTLRYDQLKTMKLAGVRAVQPGIESLGSQTLRLMRKGCTGLQNIQMLRWCEELGMYPTWNMLYGFPGEAPSEYGQMAEFLPLLMHLPPPAFCIRVRMDRFSPLYNQSAELGLENVRVMGAYSYVYPLPESALRNLAYFFEFDYKDGRLPADYALPVVKRIEEWAALAETKPPRLDAYGVRDLLVIVDTRPCATRRQHVFTGLAARVYQECDTAAKLPNLARRLLAPEADVRRVIDRFLADNLMLEMDGQILSLAVLHNRESVAGQTPVSALEPTDNLVQLST